MRELTADLFISLDGFASGVNQPPYFGYFGPDLADWVSRHLAEPQVILMGRVTFEALAQFSASAADELSLRMTSLPKLVFSKTLQAPLSWRNSRVVKGELADEVRVLKQQPGDPLRCIGSISLVRNTIRLGLLDRLRLMVFPITLGSAGREPIFSGYPQTSLELIKTEILDSRLVLLEYHPRSKNNT